MINERNKFNNKIEDDVAFGLYVEEHIPIAYDNNLFLHSLVFYLNYLDNGWNSNINDFINFFNTNNNKLNYICYRNKTNNRDEDVKIMDYIYTNMLK